MKKMTKGQIFLYVMVIIGLGVLYLINNLFYPPLVMRKEDFGYNIYAFKNHAFLIRDGDLYLLSVTPEGTFHTVSILDIDDPIVGIAHNDKDYVFVHHNNHITLVDYSDMTNPEVKNVIYQRDMRDIRDIANRITRFFISDDYMAIQYGAANFPDETEYKLSVDVLNIQNIHAPQVLHRFENYAIEGLYDDYLIGYRVPNSSRSGENSKLQVLEISSETPKLQLEGDFKFSYASTASSEINYFEDKAYYVDSNHGMYIIDFSNDVPHRHDYLEGVEYLYFEINANHVVVYGNRAITFLNKETLRPIPFSHINNFPLHGVNFVLIQENILLVLHNSTLSSYKLN